MRIPTRVLLFAVAVAVVSACATGRGRSGSSIKTGPETGSVFVVGGGSMGPELFRKFIELAGGPDAPIVVIPTASGAASYSQNDGSARQFRAFGAKDVVVMHTTDRAIANSDSFVARLKQARGIWFGGGRHYRLVDSYEGTKSEAAFHDVLARGGVVGGSSAGASILASYLIRGAPSNNNFIMSHPRYLKGFGFLKNIAIDQHVVARGRLPDLADSVISKHPKLLGISVDEGTAWVIRGDTGEIIGRGKAFAYNGIPNDNGMPFLTLLPGYRYNLGARRLIRTPIEGTRLSYAYVDTLFREIGTAPATILVAQNGRVLVNRSWNVPPQERYQPTTTTRSFALGGISDAMLATAGMQGTPAEVPAGELAQMAQRLIGRAGLAHTRFDTTTRAFVSNVDNLYRWERVLSAEHEARTSSVQVISTYWTVGGKRNAFVRHENSGSVVIILTENDSFDARRAAQIIIDRLR